MHDFPLPTPHCPVTSLAMPPHTSPPLSTQVFMMREKDGRSKGCAFIRFFDRCACCLAPRVAAPVALGLQPLAGCRPSHIELQPLAHRVAASTRVLAPLLLTVTVTVTVTVP